MDVAILILVFLLVVATVVVYTILSIAAATKKVDEYIKDTETEYRMHAVDEQ